MGNKNQPQPANDNTQYRRAKNSTIILAMLQGASCGCFYSAIGSVSYAANLGFGISVLLVGTLMTLARLFDGITDPIISMIIDKCNTRFSTFTVCLSGIFLLFSLIGLSRIDKPENFTAVSSGSSEKVRWRDMLSLLKDNKGLQCYILAATSDKLAMTISGQAIIGTLLYGVVIGNMQLSAILNIIAIIPIFIFAGVSGKYTGKHGSRKSIIFWSIVSIAVNSALIVFILISARRPVAESLPMMILFVILTMVQNGMRISVSIPTGSMMADVVDYEAYRSGKYMPGAVAGTYSFIDKAVSSVGAVSATFCVALIGYKDVMPQPTDPKTMPIVLLICAVFYGLPILGWICSLIAMKKTPVTREMMIEVQKTIAERENA